MIFSKKDNFFRVIVITFCLVLIFSTTTAFTVTTLLSYNGTGIRSKPSVDNFQLTGSTRIKLDHYTTAVKYTGTQPDSDAVLYVKLQRKGTVFFSDTGDSITTVGVDHKTATWTKGEGTYRLHFETKAISETYWPGVDIKGLITK